MENKKPNKTLKIIIHTPLVNGSETHVNISVLDPKVPSYRIEYDRVKNGVIEKQFHGIEEWTALELDRQFGGLTSANANGNFSDGAPIDFDNISFLRGDLLL